MNVLIWALDGRIEMLRSIFGDATDKPTGRPMTPDRFRSFAENHNKRYAEGQRQRRPRGK